MDATRTIKTIKKRAAVLLTASALMLTAGAGAALAANLAGDSGPDRLLGSPDNDVLRGFGGKDFLNGRADSDRLFGGRGNDTIMARDGEGDFINCGPGRDTVRADADNEDRIAANCEIVKKPASQINLAQAADDNGNDSPEVGDDNGNDGIEDGDDNGDDGPEIGDDNGDDGPEIGDDNGDDGQELDDDNGNGGPETGDDDGDDGDDGPESGDDD